ncbi:MAG: hypothetical protein WED09_07405 [Homoserinimonas sp.]
MTVQIQPAKPKDQHNGLAAIEEDILGAKKGETITAIVTFERVKRVEDESKDETYPVLRMRHIEPIRTEEALGEAQALQLAAYQSRTGEIELDLDFDGEGEGDE